MILHPFFLKDLQDLLDRFKPQRPQEILKRIVDLNGCKINPEAFKLVLLSVSFYSTTVGTVGRFSVTAALTTSFLCQRLPNLCESVTPATPSSCSDAPPIQHERVLRRCRDGLEPVTLMSTTSSVLYRIHMPTYIYSVCC